MVQIISAQNITLSDLTEKFGLTISDDGQFSPEWLDNLPEITDLEKQLLDRVKANYLSLINRHSVSENMVKMVIVEHLLDLAGFYQLPFEVKDEKPIDIAVPNEDAIVRGRVDFLVLKNLLWLAIIESKNAGVSIREAISQTLAYMLANPQPENPIFSLLTNGDDFVFIKLIYQSKPLYTLSEKFTLCKQENELYRVLKIMKKIGGLIGN